MLVWVYLHERTYHLVHYMGKLTYTQPCDTLYTFNTNIGEKCVFIDGRDLKTSNWSRFINTEYDHEYKLNVCAVMCTNNDSLNGYIMLYTKKWIYADDELLMTYGDVYDNHLKGLHTCK